MSWNARISWVALLAVGRALYEDAVIPERTKTGEAVRQQQPMSRTESAGVVWAMPNRAGREGGQRRCIDVKSRIPVLRKQVAIRGGRAQ